MDSEKAFMLRLISSAVSIAKRAGEEIRRINSYERPGEIVVKGHQDYQTEADRESQRLIVASLAKRFPKCTIVGEEDLIEDKQADARLVVESFDEDVLKKSLPNGYGYEKVTEEDITIWVDPLDGTFEYVKGHVTHATVLIGISINGSAVAGIIHQPFYDVDTNIDTNGRTMWGLVGLGCFGVKPDKLYEKKFIITTTASHSNKDVEEAIDAMKPDEVLKVGGAGYKVLLVLEGRAHSYVFASSGCKKWDTAAPEAILKASGGHFTDVFGNPIEYNHRSDNNYHNYLGIVASANESIHSKIIKNIPANVAKQLAEVEKQNLRPKC